MVTLIEQLHQLFYNALLKKFPELSKMADFSCEITPSVQEQFGHYQFNSAMRLSKPLQKNGRQISEAILPLIALHPMIGKAEVAGPGFINIVLHPDYLAKSLQAITADPNLGIAPPKKPQRIVVEFSSPNVAKELHVGHLRSTIIGDSLARLFEFLGHDVLRLNHIGDWGTPFGMLIAYLKMEAPGVLSGQQKTDLIHLQGWYQEAKRRFDRDLPFKNLSQSEVVSLQAGDPESLKAWGIICEISRRGYQEIYDLLDVHLVERGESFYNPILDQVVRDLEAKGLVTVSDDARCIFLDGFTNREGLPLPMIIQKSDGGYNYATTDMAAIQHRISEERAERIIIVTDAGQATHFQMIFAAARRAGYWNPQAVRLDHVTFGLVLGPDGKKFRTREGGVEKLIDLLNAAIEKAAEIIALRSPNLDKIERDQLARILGIGAVKYADLSCNRTGDYQFSYDRMLRFDGNTAVFLLYAYVRIAGIKRKIGKSGEGPILLEHPSEITLGLYLLQFQEVLDQLAEDLLPNRLTEYLYQLAQKFNAFYRDCQVEGTSQQSSRLQICEFTARTLKQGLHLLGVETVERM